MVVCDCIGCRSRKIWEKYPYIESESIRIFKTAAKAKSYRKHSGDGMLEVLPIKNRNSRGVIRCQQM